ncbi:MAG: hypothetical protein H0T45_02560 [Pyrinomonadaceae bacterium]|nr:hypothetical protein [Pyrinomonadaceae bacterium]
MSATLDKIIEEVKALRPDERRELRDKLDSLFIEPKPAMTEDEFARHLAAKGIISLPALSAEDTEDDDWEPVEVTGQPLSEMIIEERR